jgi:hypothetical protein
MATPTLIIDRAQANVLLSAEEPINPTDMMKLLRFLNRHCEDQDNKMRQLKSEIGRVARK